MTAARAQRKAPHLEIVLLVSYGALFILCAIHPADRFVWLIENVLALVLVAALVVTARPFPFSRLSYILIYVFLCLHTVGAHYTYAQVPYDVWFEAVTGQTFNELVGWERNHFDRVVHFGYGLLFGYPIREIFLRIADAKGFWGYLLPLLATMATSLIYELIEWWAALAFGDGVGMTYLGTQGDEWDAQWDMALASAGTIIAMAVTAAINLSIQRDFAREWNESLRVKRHRPLGEVALDEALAEREG